jgi:hypothetical protein
MCNNYVKRLLDMVNINDPGEQVLVPPGIHIGSMWEPGQCSRKYHVGVTVLGMRFSLPSRMYHVYRRFGVIISHIFIAYFCWGFSSPLNMGYGLFLCNVEISGNDTAWLCVG